MNPETPAEAIELAKQSDIEGLIIAPPFLFIEDVKENIKKAELGAQDLFWEEKGAFTGEVSAKELKALGVKYAIIGHSERRKNLGETDEIIAKKIKAAVEVGITPILCVGESADERSNGETERVIARELEIGLSLYPKPYTLNPIIIAYEPIWAIGTGSPDTPQDMINMVQYIRGVLRELPITPPAMQGQALRAGNYQLLTSIIYGGSIDSANVREFLKHKEIDGVLVGGASLKPEEIKKIVAVAINE